MAQQKTMEQIMQEKEALEQQIALLQLEKENEEALAHAIRSQAQRHAEKVKKMREEADAVGKFYAQMQAIAGNKVGLERLRCEVKTDGGYYKQMEEGENPFIKLDDLCSMEDVLEIKFNGVKITVEKHFPASQRWRASKVGKYKMSFYDGSKKERSPLYTSAKSILERITEAQQILKRRETDAQRQQAAREKALADLKKQFPQCLCEMQKTWKSDRRHSQGGTYFYTINIKLSNKSHVTFGVYADDNAEQGYKLYFQEYHDATAAALRNDVAGFIRYLSSAI